MKKVKILNHNYQIEELVVEDRPSVVIADTFESLYDLVEIVEGLGYESYFCWDYWPRDRINSFNDCYIPCKNRLRGRKIGAGGYFVCGKDYSIFSEDIYEKPGLRNKLAETLEDFFEVPVYMVEAYACRNSIGHMDLTVLPIPQKDILIVDSRHYKQQKERFEEIAEAQEQKLVVAEGCHSWACNCLVLEKDGEPVVVANEKTKKFQKLLSKLNLDYVTVLSDVSPSLNGSIRCSTNQAASPELFPHLGLKVQEA